MKKLIYSTLFLFFIAGFISCGPTPQEAVDYNDKIINEQIAVITKLDALNSSYENYVAKEMDAAYDGVSKQINQSLEVVNALPDFHGNDELKNAAIELFNAYKSAVETEHTEMIRLYKIPEEQFSQEEVNQWEKLADKAEQKINASFQKFAEQQKKFAKKYKFELEKNKK